MPKLVFAYLNRALAWADEQEDDKSLEDFAAALRIAPEIAGAYVERAWLRTRRQEFNEALADLNEAVRLQPDMAPAYLHRGRLHLQQGNYDDALRDFDRVIELAPELGAAYSSRGSVWIQKGEHDKADADFQQAIACEPGMAEAFVMERLLLEAAYYGRQEEFDEAIGRATEAIELDEDCLPAYAIRAGAYWYSEQLVEAIDDFTQLIERNDEDDFHATRAAARCTPSWANSIWPWPTWTTRSLWATGKRAAGGRPRPAWPTPTTAAPWPWPAWAGWTTPCGTSTARSRTHPTTPGATTTAAWSSTTWASPAKPPPVSSKPSKRPTPRSHPKTRSAPRVPEAICQVTPTQPPPFRVW